MTIVKIKNKGMPFYPTGAPYLHQGISSLAEPFARPTLINYAIDQVALCVTNPVHHNSAIAILSVRIAANSVLGYVGTNDDTAKFFYILSFSLATSAAGLSGNAALTRACQINQAAV